MKTKNKKTEIQTTQTLKDGTLEKVNPKTAKPEETSIPIDETAREYQTHGGAWERKEITRHAPTSHTSNEIRVRVLDPIPTLGKEADHGNAVSGSEVKVLADWKGVPQVKQTWGYKEPKREILE